MTDLIFGPKKSDGYNAYVLKIKTDLSNWLGTVDVIYLCNEGKSKVNNLPPFLFQCVSFNSKMYFSLFRKNC